MSARDALPLPLASSTSSRSSGPGHHYSKSHSGLNTYTSPRGGSPGPAQPGNTMDRSTSSSGLSPISNHQGLASNGSVGITLSPNGSGASSHPNKFRASVDASRGMYTASNGNLTPSGGAGGGGIGNHSLGPSRAGSKRPSSEMLAGTVLTGLGGAGLNAESKLFVFIPLSAH